MKKVYFIVFTFLFILIIFLLAFTTSNKQNISTTTPSSAPTPTIFYVPPSIPTPIIPTPTPVDKTSSSISIYGVTVNNFYKTAQPVDTEGDVQLEKVQNSYQILYLPQFNEFLISILGSPFDTIRTQAENELLSQLGISQQQACQLNVSEGTPQRINPNEAGISYPLSFCSEASPTP